MLVVLVFWCLFVVDRCLLFVVRCIGVRCLTFVDCCSRCALPVCGWLLVGRCWLSVVAFVLGSWCLAFGILVLSVRGSLLVVCCLV